MIIPPRIEHHSRFFMDLATNFTRLCCSSAAIAVYGCQATVITYAELDRESGMEAYVTESSASTRFLEYPILFLECRSKYRIFRSISYISTVEIRRFSETQS